MPEEKLEYKKMRERLDFAIDLLKRNVKKRK